jgi:hypothetical protein
LFLKKHICIGVSQKKMSVEIIENILTCNNCNTLVEGVLIDKDKLFYCNTCLFEKKVGTCKSCTRDAFFFSTNPEYDELKPRFKFVCNFCLDAVRCTTCNANTDDVVLCKRCHENGAQCPKCIGKRKISDHWYCKNCACHYEKPNCTQASVMDCDKKMCTIHCRKSEGTCGKHKVLLVKPQSRVNVEHELGQFTKKILQAKRNIEMMDEDVEKSGKELVLLRSDVRNSLVEKANVPFISLKPKIDKIFELEQFLENEYPQKRSHLFKEMKQAIEDQNAFFKKNITETE